MTPRKSKTQQGRERLSELPAGNQEFVKTAVREALEEVLEAEVEQALGAAKSERTSERLGCRRTGRPPARSFPTECAARNPSRQQCIAARPRHTFCQPLPCLHAAAIQPPYYRKSSVALQPRKPLSARCWAR